ncbi:unnamed protein product (macronuclear) [Paramecium tetraurelia]|uniref:PX domain-containing protein n=1 Tax=Paramecium tetraurelia TaxID=5888 RepID=A0E0T5_PARTE|nr:uncharacterized protein GSPATT00022070001 [Paramecium tetraurelia]CAK88902.1 unnamed protein product [Paramecium tetraurelia]|eukprot:XP_001456299.1 hypothetical protein (macronuclear) [Paramecium tetraurelia strain d4-2]
MNKNLSLSFSKSSTKPSSLDLDSPSDQENSPILSFLEKQKKRAVSYIGFRVVTIQVKANHAYYMVMNICHKFQIEVNEYGTKWIMMTRFSVLQTFYKGLSRLFEVKCTLSSHFEFNQLSPRNLKKRAIKIQTFLNQIGNNFKILNSKYCQQFLNEQKCLGQVLIDYTKEQNLVLEA